MIGCTTWTTHTHTQEAKKRFAGAEWKLSRQQQVVVDSLNECAALVQKIALEPQFPSTHDIA
ncbi:hypothetical protein CISG_00894 [Coccidioides immitis RMSCC 3703]|uniref:Uncharacterized protein n=1 Tax=Coccidioides immitis RMSCC 3703 TaxID=454286 RepID=A0A0J8QSB1_COCIT|nr:hypothetical protein CISG_00894 [Coccidioides immitis RMSCC 3703]